MIQGLEALLRDLLLQVTELPRAKRLLQEYRARVTERIFGTKQENAEHLLNLPENRLSVPVESTPDLVPAVI